MPEREGSPMARNVKRLLLPNFMSAAGLRILEARPDVEAIVYPVADASEAFERLLPEASGVALSPTPFRRAEIERSPALQVVARIGVGFDAVEIPALTERG